MPYQEFESQFSSVFGDLPCRNSQAERDRQEAKEITTGMIDDLVNSLISEWEKPGRESQLCKEFSEEVTEQIGEQSEKVFKALFHCSDATEGGFQLQALRKSVAESFVQRNLERVIEHFDYEVAA